GDHIRLQSYGYGTSPDIDMKLNPGGGNVILNETAGNVGIGTGSPGTYKLYCNGSAAKPGGGSWTDPSDKRLKDIHGSYTRGLNEILQLNPISYNYKQDNDLDLPAEEEYIGLIAQEVQKLIPEAVEKMESGYFAVNNDPILWAMLNAIKEQQAQIEDFKSVNQSLQEQLEEFAKRLKILENK
ncbi:MAG: tail fiber domain-containing protein, partial [Bacteroidales bacterium]|nr:tail fiber domain-containing protein [Bacteroidales bacterium]